MKAILGLLFALGAAARPADSYSALAPRAACSGNTATTRSSWCDWSVDDDYYTTGPDTGVIREYWLSLEDSTVSPDGVSRSAMTINGSIPGPTIIGDWGDTFKIHVTNNLASSSNGTSIHWHGLRQNYTNEMDGVASITQCPTAPGETLTYTFKATQYGTTWYHSHFSLQAWEGVAGGIIINGPATQDYDEDAGVILLSDWDHQTVDELWPTVRSSGPVPLDTGLINGTNVWDDGGERFKLAFESGTSYRLRIVNTAIDSHWKFSIDSHSLTVIASDLVPVTPYDTQILNIGIGMFLPCR
jgi:FtsP/CotA-like multicopper oxidase with cupredoxin domain